MKKIITVLLSAAFVFITASQAFAGTITVSGTGEVLIPADTAVVSLGVTARNKDVKEAQQAVNTAIADIIQALTQAGVPKEDINTGYLSINAVYDYNGDLEEISAYSASSALAVRTADMEKIGDLIDTAFEAGANTLDGISFSASESDEYLPEALKKAVNDAKTKADILAEASGMKITGIKSIDEGGTYSYDRGVMNNFSMKQETADAAAGTYVQAAKLTLNASITIVYETED